jgi:hypothetical protein
MMSLVGPGFRAEVSARGLPRESCRLMAIDAAAVSASASPRGCWPSCVAMQTQHVAWGEVQASQAETDERP